MKVECTGCLPKSGKSHGILLLPQKVGEKSGNLDKSQGKVRESFLRAANFRESIKISIKFKHVREFRVENFVDTLIY